MPLPTVLDAILDDNPIVRSSTCDPWAEVRHFTCDAEV